MKKSTFTLVLCAYSLFFGACQKENNQPIKQGILFLGHTYQSETEVDERLEKLDLKRYEHIWLGGDICGASDRKPSTSEYINTLFGINKAGNHWALGNHDIHDNNYHWIKEATGKPEFYAEYNDGLTVVVINTNLYAPDCDRLEEQYQMFKNVCDTISKSSHLIILGHHVVWNHVREIPNLWEQANGNKPFWEARCQPNSRFEQVMYNELIKVQNRGVQVMILAGDFGQKAKSFQQKADSGILFFGSGIDRSNRYMPDSLKDSAKDLILFFHHDKVKRTLDWQFLDLDSLVQEK